MKTITHTQDCQSQSQLYAVTVTFKDGTTRNVTQEGNSAIDAITLIAHRLYCERHFQGDVVSVALTSF